MTTDVTGFIACDCAADRVPLPGGLVHATDRGPVEHRLGPPGLGTWIVKFNAQLREHITATTNKVEAYNGFAKWLNFGGEGVIDTLDPVEQEKHLKYNHLVENAAAIQNVIDLTPAVRALQADAYIIHRDDLAQLSPYQTRRQRFGDYTLSLSPPEPFDAELLMPFQLDEQPETVVVA